MKRLSVFILSTLLILCLVYISVGQIPTMLPVSPMTVGLPTPLTIIGDNATLKLVDDSGNIAVIKAGNSQLTLAADPDNAVASTDIVFDIDGVEVGRFQQGKGFQSKRGFATELWDVASGHWETATTGVEYYSPNQQGGIYGSSDNHIYIMLSGASGGGNLSFAKAGYSSQKGWVDYTK